ncbi:uncharacterized protein MONBRDRAFT_25917 [Monosiga brevicollis MX1]|uniref:Transmembrane BAX inhibitor motif-containing protein 4 n=1 Tax=Monosiga brevicollis TaxID=81824 RepID=A9V0U8_MONBE|nr:uncharacterized protein MONBRDRAFT_25917 [Monosiga brevicollis MX1]EDQ88698.1 predicted protein [Monosiga brevicollis MX1]|eukprot:XP_001746311.1 hypothetical protein [Monosiga brevicollis MX1]
MATGSQQKEGKQFQSQSMGTSDHRHAATPSAPAADDFMYGVHVASCHLKVRMAFLRKVYGIVCAQLLCTTLMAAFFVSSPTVKTFVQSSPTIYTLASWVMIGLTVALMVFRKSSPLNYQLLTAFVRTTHASCASMTLVTSYVVGTTVTFYELPVVIEAALLTSVITVGLTAFAFQTKHDFTFLNSFLVTGLWLMIGISLIMWFFPPSSTVELAYSVIGALLFSAFIVVDTQLMLNKLSPEEYILCAINLYLDIINLFLEILRIMSKRN